MRDGCTCQEGDRAPLPKGRAARSCTLLWCNVPNTRTITRRLHPNSPHHVSHLPSCHVASVLWAMTRFVFHWPKRRLLFTHNYCYAVTNAGSIGKVWVSCVCSSFSLFSLVRSNHYCVIWDFGVKGPESENGYSWLEQVASSSQAQTYSTGRFK